MNNTELAFEMGRVGFYLGEGINLKELWDEDENGFYFDYNYGYEYEQTKLANAQEY